LKLEDPQYHVAFMIFSLQTLNPEIRKLGIPGNSVTIITYKSFHVSQTWLKDSWQHIPKFDPPAASNRTIGSHQETWLSHPVTVAHWDGKKKPPK